MISSIGAKIWNRTLFFMHEADGSKFFIDNEFI